MVFESYSDQDLAFVRELHRRIADEPNEHAAVLKTQERLRGQITPDMTYDEVTMAFRRFAKASLEANPALADDMCAGLVNMRDETIFNGLKMAVVSERTADKWKKGR